jgi:hypothetical protein
MVIMCCKVGVEYIYYTCPQWESDLWVSYLKLKVVASTLVVKGAKYWTLLMPKTKGMMPVWAWENTPDVELHKKFSTGEYDYVSCGDIEKDVVRLGNGVYNDLLNKFLAERSVNKPLNLAEYISEVGIRSPLMYEE